MFSKSPRQDTSLKITIRPYKCWFPIGISFCWKDPRHCASIHQVRVFIGRSLLFFLGGCGCGGTTNSILHPIDIWETFSLNLTRCLSHRKQLCTRFAGFCPWKNRMQYTNHPPGPKLNVLHRPTPVFPGSPGWKFGFSSALPLRDWLH